MCLQNDWFHDCILLDQISVQCSFKEAMVIVIPDYSTDLCSFKPDFYSS